MVILPKVDSRDMGEFAETDHGLPLGRFGSIKETRQEAGFWGVGRLGW